MKFYNAIEFYGVEVFDSKMTALWKFYEIWTRFRFITYLFWIKKILQTYLFWFALKVLSYTTPL